VSAPAARNDEPSISVVICTHNRAASLQATLDSLLPQLAGTAAEVVVVDNASRDGTKAVVRSYGDRVRYVYEPELGLCRARNTGWRTATGEVVAFLDDDAIAEPGWLAAITRSFAGQPRPGIAGGRVTPQWEAERPSWLADDVAVSLTIVDWSTVTRPIRDHRGEWIVGANMAVRRDVLEQVGGFHVGLDRVGTRMLSSGDVFLQKQVMEFGHLCIYEPAMAVRHAVPAARLHQGWFTRRYYWQGVSDAAMLLIEESPGGLRRFGLALSRAARLAIAPRKLVALALPARGPARFSRKCLALIEVGFVAGMFGAAGR
jgi:glucosyl-dolichyl phosphate glucuronosyltransferase